LYDCMRGQFVLLSNHILPQSLLEFGPAIQALGVRTSLEAMEHVKEVALLVSDLQSNPAFKGFLHFIEGAAQWFNPRQNWAGRFPATATHFAVLITLEDNSQCILERLRDRVRRENIGHCDPLQEGQKLQLEGQDNVVVKVTKVNQWKDLKSFQDKEEKHKYHGMCKNCKHLAYD
ncbi:unnamed protein product, partial [Effrenium voratum]